MIPLEVTKMAYDAFVTDDERKKREAIAELERLQEFIDETLARAKGNRSEVSQPRTDTL